LYTGLLNHTPENSKASNGLGTHFNWVSAIHIALPWPPFSATWKRPARRIWQLHHQWQVYNLAHTNFLCHLHHPHIGCWHSHLHWLISSEKV